MEKLTGLYLRGAMERFKQQRWRASARGIGWELSFEQWLDIWMQSGKWHLRGKGSGKFVMIGFINAARDVPDTLTCAAVGGQANGPAVDILA